MILLVEPVRRAQGNGRVIALTIDDGPAPDTAAMLDVLGALGVRATFCVVGERVATLEGAALLRRTVSDGHALANHGWSYADLGRAPRNTIRADLLKTNAAIRDVVGDVPVRWYRAANGLWGRTAEVAVQIGLQPLGVTGTIDDWLTQDVPALEANLRRALVPGGLLLVHDGGGDRRGTVAAVQKVLNEALAVGWQFTLPSHPGVR